MLAYGITDIFNLLPQDSLHLLQENHQTSIVSSSEPYTDVNLF